MSRRTLLPLSFLIVLLTSMLSPASTAATPKFNYIGYSGGTQIQALGTTISSDLTAQSGISGSKLPNADSTNVAAVRAGTLASIGAVETSVTAAAFGDGVRLTSKAQTARINLLNGLIKADAVKTTNVSTATVDGGMVAASNTEFVNLSISGNTLPVVIPKNYTIGIPGVATITLNGSQTVTKAGGSYTTGFGLSLTLLQARGTAPAGARVILNPTFAATLPPIPFSASQLGGMAYGTRVTTDVGSEISVEAGRSAPVGTPPSGTENETLRNSTLAVRVPGVINAGAVESTSKSVTVPGFAEITNTNQIANLFLFSGLIQAKAIKVTAHSRKVDGVFTADQKLEFVGLKIAGQPIDINIAPNTSINVANLGIVTLNQQIETANANLIRALDIKLTFARAGLPIGAHVEVAVATTWIIN